MANKTYASLVREAGEEWSEGAKAVYTAATVAFGKELKAELELLSPSEGRTTRPNIP